MGEPRSTDQSPPRECGPRLPEHLPVIEEVIVPEQVKLAPQQWRRISEEVSERLDYEPARFLRRRTVRPKYVPRGILDAVPIMAPLPDSLLAGSLVSPGLLAQIVVSKYCDHVPLYRQESIYWTRHQVWLPRQRHARKRTPNNVAERSLHSCRSSQRWPNGSAWPRSGSSLSTNTSGRES